MSGRRRTRWELELAESMVACFECYHYPGSGETSDEQCGVMSRHGTLARKDGETLPFASTGWRKTSGPCPECIGTGVKWLFNE